MSHKIIHKVQRRNDVRIKYRWFLAHNFPTLCRFREATCSPLQYNCTFCVSSIRKISECFATSLSSKTFARLQSVRNKGSKGYPATTLSCALFILSRLFRFPEFSTEFFLFNRSPPYARAM